MPTAFGAAYAQSPYIQYAKKHGNVFGIASPSMPSQRSYQVQQSYDSRLQRESQASQALAQSESAHAGRNKLTFWEGAVSVVGGVLAGHMVSKAAGGNQGLGVFVGSTLASGSMEMFQGGDLQSGLKKGLTTGVGVWAGFALTKGTDIGDKLRSGMSKGGDLIDDKIFNKIPKLGGASGISALPNLDGVGTVLNNQASADVLSDASQYYSNLSSTSDAPVSATPATPKKKGGWFSNIVW